MWKDALSALRIGVVCCALALALSASFVQSQAPEHGYRYNSGTSANDQCEKPKTFWQRLTCDPVAFFTSWLAVFTFVLTGTSIFQLIGLRKANEVATRAAETADRSLKELNRAFVFLEGLRPTPTVDGGKAVSWRITPVWENSGTTPTRHMLNYVSHGFYAEEPDPSFPDIHSPIAQGEQVWIPLGPKAFGALPRQDSQTQKR